MNTTAKFWQDRWSLYVRFDTFVVQQRRLGASPLGDAAELHRHILETFGGLSEEYPEIIRELPGGVIEITSSIVDWLTDVINWILGYTIPAEVRLVRNEE